MFAQLASLGVVSMERRSWLAPWWKESSILTSLYAKYLSSTLRSDAVAMMKSWMWCTSLSFSDTIPLLSTRRRSRCWQSTASRSSWMTAEGTKAESCDSFHFAAASSRSPSSLSSTAPESLSSWLRMAMFSSSRRPALASKESASSDFSCSDAVYVKSLALRSSTLARYLRIVSSWSLILATTLPMTVSWSCSFTSWRRSSLRSCFSVSACWLSISSERSRSSSRSSMVWRSSLTVSSRSMFFSESSSTTSAASRATSSCSFSSSTFSSACRISVSSWRTFSSSLGSWAFSLSSSLILLSRSCFSEIERSLSFISAAVRRSLFSFSCASVCVCSAASPSPSPTERNDCACAISSWPRVCSSSCSAVAEASSAISRSSFMSSIVISRSSSFSFSCAISLLRAAFVFSASFSMAAFSLTFSF
mmetsp:Transcript_17030/g.66359  ORF Transcript_17030/g.66359 Transcript_17030/m.66359 type:complete len:420 (+) Transcript_17030:1708-2967(+)